jgi:hypothetical protein
MRKSRASGLGLSFALGAGLLAAGGTTRADVYPDGTGSAEHWSDSYADIASVTITNDLTNLFVTVTVNPLMNDGVTPTNVQTSNFTRYDMGFQVTSPVQPNGGNTSLTEPFGQSIGISTGQHYNLEGWANQNASPSTLGGYALNHWNGASWDNVGNSSTDVVTPSGKSFVVPLSALGLSGGGTFFFDVWTTFSGTNGAYDALANPTRPGQPFNPGLVPYDSATASGTLFGTAAYQYTVIVPEPASIGALSVATLGALIRRRRR